MSSRALLITPKFYGVEVKIKSAFEKSGYEVVWFENKSHVLDYHGTGSKLKFFRKIYCFLFSPQKRYVKEELSKIENLKFDILLAINGNSVCPYLFRILRINNPDLFSAIYLWDAVSKYSWLKEIKYFDKAFTFDPSDSEKFKIEYKPNFFIGNSGDTIVENRFDLFFTGKFNHFRLSVLDKITEQADVFGIKYCIMMWPAYKIFFHNYFIYRFLKMLKVNDRWIIEYVINYEAVEGILDRKYLVESSISYDLVQASSLSSNVILDLPYPGQSGLTHRVIEALANGKKIITSNFYISKQSFYNPSQVHIIDSQNPEIDFEWIREKEIFPVSSSIAELELTQWLKAVINVEIA